MSAIKYLRRIGLTLVLAAFALLLHTSRDFQSWCEFNVRDASLPGLYRILTCHCLHWSTEHLTWDLVVFVVLGAICESCSRVLFTWTVLLSAVAIPPSIVIQHPQVETYRGLSGIDTALFGQLVSLLLVQRIYERDRGGAIFFSLFVVGLFGKIGLEMVSRSNIFVSDTTFIPLPISHLVGAVIGLMMGMTPQMFGTHSPPLPTAMSVRQQDFPRRSQSCHATTADSPEGFL